MRARSSIAVIVFFAIPGCFLDRSGVVEGSVDAGRMRDGGAMTDGGRVDAGMRDAGMRDAGMRDAGMPDSGQPPTPDAGSDAGQSCTELFRGTQGFQRECSAPPGECVLYVNVDPMRLMCTEICGSIGWNCQGSGGAAGAADPCAVATTGSCTDDLRIQACRCAPP